MSLRARLMLSFVVVLLVPLVVAIVLLATIVPSSARAQASARASDARAVVATRLQADCSRALAAGVLAAQQAANPSAAVLAAVSADRVTAAQLVDANGRVLASTLAPGAVPAVLVGARTATDCRGGPASIGPQAVTARVTLTDPLGRTRGVALATVALDPLLTGDDTALAALAAGTPAGLTLVRPGAAPVGTLSAATAARIGARVAGGDLPATTVRDDGHYLAVIDLADDARLAVSVPTPHEGGLVLSLVLSAVVAVLLALLFGVLAARFVTGPLTEITAAAARIAGGDLDTRMRGGRRDEVGVLGTAFNRMTDELAATIRDLRGSRDELRRTVARLGEALAGTHDLDRILGVIVESALALSGAGAGALLLTAADGEALYLSVGRGLEGRLPADGGTEVRGRQVSARWRDGNPGAAAPPGVTARVAATGETLRGPVGGADGLLLAADEPVARQVLALPLRSSGRVTGVLDLYDRLDGRPFDETDEERVRSFVAQATVAIDNVLLHQEAQRLSITDALTGLWNYRYVTLALAREVERAHRFARPLAVLMLDLDRFKRVNDVYGHQRGDAVLAEVALRVRSVVREVDILARYGGEELLLVLPETDVAGAVHLADRICDVVRNRNFGGAGEEPIRMTTSVGIAVLPTHAENATTMVRAADAALYVAKAAGRDCYRLAAPPPGPLLPGPVPDVGPPG